MRIASLVPSATEMCFALDLGESVVAVTHECDYPPEAVGLPTLTRSVIAEGLSASEIDAAVRERTQRGESLYELDEAALAELGVELIVTQQVCAVCAVSFDDVRSVAARLPGQPEVISLDPGTLGEVLEDARRLADAAAVPERGEQLRDRLRDRIETVREAVSGTPRPRVAALEWLDPPYAAGHWVPEMIDAAGGIDALAAPGERSREASWEELAGGEPDVAIAMPCGLYCPEAAAEGRGHAAELASLGASRAYAVDAAASFSRPGPRLADGVELLGHLLHPDLVAPPKGLAFESLAPVER